MAESCLMATTCENCNWVRWRRISVWSRRKPICSTIPFAPTSCTPSQTPRRLILKGRPRSLTSRLHRRFGGRLRYHRGRAWLSIKRRREAAYGHRPRCTQRSTNPGSGRSDKSPRQSVRGFDPRCAKQNHARPDQYRHRAPTQYHSRCRQDPGSGSWPNRRRRHS